ncbi:hypothetical protein NHX12_031142 [Muraenolepis orangiensis]|uniref:Uncharacterized protein n=1 Tax=Muraenolepis orangiensis TaxID=630683 RepID=A0A9Q0IM99_9TELE|nr:hypothetical protein NHX12_031142 [Muraenolepis orangiensis]
MAHLHRLNGRTEQFILIIVTVFMQDTDTTTKREIALKCLILNVGESVEDLIKEFLPETIAIFIIRDAQAAPKDIGIILEGQEVVNKLASVTNAVAILLGFLYALNLEYPKTLKFMFQYIQKVFIELDPKGMPTKVKKLYDQLYNSA